MPRSAPVEPAPGCARRRWRRTDRACPGPSAPAAADARPPPCAPIGPVTLNGLRLAGAIDVRHHAGRGPEAGDAAEGGRRAQAAAVVGAGRERHLAQRQRHRRAARGAGAGLRRVERDCRWRRRRGWWCWRRRRTPACWSCRGSRRRPCGCWRRWTRPRPARGPCTAASPTWCCSPAVACRSLTPIGRPASRPGILAAADGLLDLLGAACAPRPHPWPRWR